MSGSFHVGLLGKLDIHESLSGGHHVLVLDTHNTTTPGSSDADVLDVSLGEGSAELLNLDEILRVDLGEGNAGSCLKVNKLSEGSLATDEAEWDALLSAESWKVNHELEWVDIVGNHDKLGLLFFNEGGDVVETELKKLWLGTEVSVLVGLELLSSLLKSIDLLLLGLWGVFGEELEEFGS